MTPQQFEDFIKKST